MVKTKEWVSVLLVLILVASLFAACGNEEASEAGMEEATKTVTEESKVSKEAEETDGGPVPGQLPISEEKIKLTVFVVARPKTDDFTNNEFTKWLEEQTNIELEFITAAANEKDQKLNLLMASGDYPDIIMNAHFSMDTQTLYGEDGILIPLNDLIEKYGVETKRVFDEAPGLKEQISDLSGNIYSLPSYSVNYHMTHMYKMWIYEPWLDAVGMDMPTTTEEFYQVLKAFKEQDPNGNGEADEIPLAGSTRFSMNLDGFLLNPFVYNSNESGTVRLILKNGKIESIYDADGLKEGLKYINKLYSEGLISPQSFTQDKNQIIQMGENPDTVILGAAPGLHMGFMSQLNGESGRWAEYKTVPPLKGPSGLQQSTYTPTEGRFVFNITDACEYPVEAFMLGDFLYSEEASLRSVRGRPDVEWTFEAEGMENYKGEPALWKALIPVGKQDMNVHWHQTGNYYIGGDFQLRQAVGEEDILVRTLYSETETNYDPYRPEEGVRVPSLIIRSEDLDEYADLKVTLRDYYTESVAKFIIGAWNFEEDWNTYVEELNKIGLDRYLELSQEAYDAKK